MRKTKRKGVWLKFALLLLISGFGIMIASGVRLPRSSDYSIKIVWGSETDPVWTIDVIGDENFRILSDSVVRVLIDYLGNMGIGTTTPTARLEVAGQVKITGGGPGTGKVLTSDAVGLATWGVPVDIYSYYRTGTAAPEVWYTSPYTGTALTTGAPTANVLRAIPFIVQRTITLDRIAINVTTAVAGLTRLGIYADGGNTYPGARVIDAGEVDTGTTGVKAITISLTLSPGLYWLVAVSNAAPTIRAFAVGSLIPVLGYGSALGTAPGLGYSVSYTYGTLPATFPSGAALITAAPIPAIFVRLSG